MESRGHGLEKFVCPRPKPVSPTPKIGYFSQILPACPRSLVCPDYTHVSPLTSTGSHVCLSPRAGVDPSELDVAYAPNSLLLELPDGWYLYPPLDDVDAFADAEAALAMQRQRTSSVRVRAGYRVGVGVAIRAIIRVEVRVRVRSRVNLPSRGSSPHCTPPFRAASTMEVDLTLALAFMRTLVRPYGSLTALHQSYTHDVYRLHPTSVSQSVSSDVDTWKQGDKKDGQQANFW